MCNIAVIHIVVLHKNCMPKLGHSTVPQVSERIATLQL